MFLHLHTIPHNDKAKTHVLQQTTIVRRALRQDCFEAQIWGKVPKHFCSIEGPQNTVTSIILKWMKFGTTGTLPRAGHLAKLHNWGRRVREVTKNLMVTLTEL